MPVFAIVMLFGIFGLMAATAVLVRRVRAVAATTRSLRYLREAMYEDAMASSPHHRAPQAGLSWSGGHVLRHPDGGLLPVAPLVSHPLRPVI